MSAVYDNWERLIRATLRREELKVIAQRSPSDISSSVSSSSSPSSPQVSPLTSFGLKVRKGSEAIKNIETHLPNADMYVGTLSRKVPQGSGKYLSRDGSTYEGDFNRWKAWEKGKPSRTSVAILEKDLLMAEMEKAIKEVMAMFNKFGKISSSELGNILNLIGSKTSPDEAQRIMEEIDTDDDGFIDMNDLVVYLTGISQTTNNEELRCAFDFFDNDKNGEISANDLHSVLISLGDKSSHNDCCRMIRPFDDDGDGCVNFDEFKKMMGCST